MKLRALGVSVTDRLDDSDEYIDKINFRDRRMWSLDRRMWSLLLPILIGLLLLLAIVAIWIASRSSTERGIDLQTTEASQPVSTELPSATPPSTIGPNNTPIPTPLPTPSPAPVQIAIRNFKVRLDNREILIDPGGTIEVREGDVLMLEVVFDNAPDGLIFVWTSERNFIPLTTTSTSSTIYNVPTGSGANPSLDTVKVEIRSGGEILIEHRFFVNIK